MRHVVPVFKLVTTSDSRETKQSNQFLPQEYTGSCKLSLKYLAETCLKLLLVIMLWQKPVCLGLKTTVPDEIIRIVKSPNYNKHHLPSNLDLSDTAASMKRNLQRGEWKLTVDFRTVLHGLYLRIIQKEDKGRVHRFVLSLKAAQTLADHAAQIYRKYNDSGSDIASKPTPSHPQTFYSSLLHDDAKQYTIDLKFDGEKETNLIIAQVKGASWNVVTVPTDQITAFAQAITEIAVAVRTIISDSPTSVTIAMYIEGLSSFRAQTMDFHIDIYFQETWIDYRLRHNSDRPVLVRDLSVFEMMWHPDLYFANAKEASFHTVTTQNFLVWISPDGTVYHDTRVSLVVNCMQDLTNYPLDTQECNIRMLSYAYDNENLNILWKNTTPITINKGIMLPDMHLVKYGSDYCLGDYGELGKWSCVVAVFRMQREVMHHVLQSYIPTALIVIISWFSFWLDTDSVPGRVSLCITTLLTLATQSSAARLSLPQGVMIEFTAVNYLGRRGASKFNRNLPRRRGRRMGVTGQFGGTTETYLGFESPQLQAPAACDNTGGAATTLNADGEKHVPLEALCQMEYFKNRKAAASIDRSCRILFPLTFLLFNIVYWPFYMNRVTAHENTSGDMVSGLLNAA